MTEPCGTLLFSKSFLDKLSVSTMLSIFYRCFSSFCNFSNSFLLMCGSSIGSTDEEELVSFFNLKSSLLPHFVWLWRYFFSTCHSQFVISPAISKDFFTLESLTYIQSVSWLYYISQVSLSIEYMFVCFVWLFFF